MAVLKTNGLVIREVPVSDSDKIITLLTEDLGKISVSAKNARKSGTRYAYGTQILTYGQYMLFKGKNAYSLNGCDTLAHFYCLANDLECFTHAAHLIELAGDAASDVQTTGKVLNLLLHALHGLSKGRNAQLITAAFSMKLMQIMGYPPHMTSCAACSTREMEAIYFGFDICGILCEKCALARNDAVLMEPGTVKAILHVLCSDQNQDVYKFELSDESLSAFAHIARRYVAERLDKQYHKLDFLKEIAPKSYSVGGNDRL